MADQNGVGLQDQVLLYGGRLATWTSLAAMDQFKDMDHIIPTISKSFRGFILRLGEPDRSLRALKSALIKLNVPKNLVDSLSGTASASSSPIAPSSSMSPGQAAVAGKLDG